MDEYKTRRRREFLGSLRYLTFSCCRCLPLFVNNDIKDAFANCLAVQCVDTQTSLKAWVLMPEHVHLLVEPYPGVTVAEFLFALKGGFANQVLRRWRELDAPILARLGPKPRFWQPGGGYDRNICSGDALEQTIRYIHQNPVARGLVTSSLDWKWSPARWYAGLRDPGVPSINPIVI